MLVCMQATKEDSTYIVVYNISASIFDEVKVFRRASSNDLSTGSVQVRERAFQQRQQTYSLAN